MEISIHTAKKEDLPTIINLANLQLGKNYLTDTLYVSINNKKQVLKVAKSQNEKILGFCLSVIKAGSVLLKSIAVNPDHTKKGVGTLLVYDCIEFAKKNNYHSIISIAWQSKYGVEMESIFTKLGFTITGEILNYWKEDSLDKGYSCPTCSKPPCLCNAVVFEKHL